MKPIRILLVDDHAIVRAGLRMLLSDEPCIEIVAEAQSGEVAGQLYREKLPDVVVQDLSMPGIGGLDCIRRICSHDGSAKILVFSVHDEMPYVTRALEAGAKGYITKNSATDILVEAIENIAAGKIYIEAGLAKQLQCRNEPTAEMGRNGVVNKLTPKEFDVLCLLAKGYTTRRIAEELRLSYKTVANYGTQIKYKLNVSTFAQLAHFAAELGVVKK